MAADARPGGRGPVFEATGFPNLPGARVPDPWECVRSGCVNTVCMKGGEIHVGR